MENGLKNTIEALQHELARAAEHELAWRREIESLKEEVRKYRTEIDEQEVLLRRQTEKIQASETVLKETYREVIKEIFQKPSRQSALLTVFAGVISIVASVVITDCYSADPVTQAITPLTGEHASSEPVTRDAVSAMKVASMPGAQQLPNAGNSAVTEADDSVECASVIIDDMLSLEFTKERASHYQSASKEVSEEGRWWGDETTVESLKCQCLIDTFNIDRHTLAFLMMKNGVPPCVALEARKHFAEWDLARFELFSSWESALRSAIDESGGGAAVPDNLDTFEHFMPPGVKENCGRGLGYHDSETLKDLRDIIVRNKQFAADQLELNTRGYSSARR